MIILSFSSLAGRHQRNHHAEKPNWNVAPQQKSVGTKNVRCSNISGRFHQSPAQPAQEMKSVSLSIISWGIMLSKNQHDCCGLDFSSQHTSNNGTALYRKWRHGHLSYLSDQQAASSPRDNPLFFRHAVCIIISFRPHFMVRLKLTIMYTAVSCAVILHRRATIVTSDNSVRPNTARPSLRFVTLPAI